METLQRTANRGSISTGFDVENSLKVEPDNAEYASFTPSSAGNRQTYTISMWVKRTELGQQSGLFGVAPTSGPNNATVFQFGFLADSKFQLGLQTFYALQTNRLFRDTSAWYHIVVAVDTTQATATNRVRLYVNGVEETSFSTDNRSSIAQNQDTGVNNTEAHTIGSHQPTSWYFAGYMAEVHHIDGQQLLPTDFGEFDEDTGIWKPKAYTGSYGTNGFYLDFKDSGSLGADSSGNGNNFTLNNITSADQATDTPTNNFCIMNVNSRTNSDITTSQGGTKVANSGASICSMNASMGVSNGKWYWECRFANDPGNTNTVFVGIAATNDPYVPHNSNNYLGQQTGYGSIGWYFVNGGIYNGTGTWSGPGYGDIIMFALDMDNLKLYFGKQGTWGNSSDPETNTNGIDIATSFTNLSGGTDIIVPAVAIAGGDNMDSMNFGGFANYTQASATTDDNGYGNFEYAPPSGYYALCSKNLAEFG